MAHHLTAWERDRIAQLLHRGWMRREIADDLKRSPSTISREIARNSTGGEYLSAQAQQQAERRRRMRPVERKMDRPEISQFVRRGLAQYWSPDQIAGRLKREFPNAPWRHVSPQTIYTWIANQDDDARRHWRQFLRRRGKRPWQRRENKGETASPARIANRPAAIEQRRRLGDFEGDTVLGPPGAGGLVTLADRRSRLLMMDKIKTKHARRVHDKIKRRMKTLSARQRRSITFDNGTEFARCQLLENHLGIMVYFAEPGRPYQRGTNENTNGLIRQFFPKGIDFRDISHHEIRCVEDLINTRPRACLDYQTPNEVFYGQDAALNCN